jgi:sec-independent protein translocase protein TatB
MWKLAALGVIAMLVFGPEKLPEMARDAGRMLRQLRGMAQAAKAELQTEIGDTLGEFDISELNPKTFVRKHLFEDDDILSRSTPAPTATAWTPPTAAAATATAAPVALEFGVPAPYDLDAT